MAVKKGGTRAEQVDAPAVQDRQRGRILLVDDSSHVTDMLGQALRRDHDVVIASNGAEAVTFLEKGGAADAVLLDLMMPGITGVDVYHWLAANRPHLAARTVLMTGGAGSKEMADFFATAPCPRLRKPFALAMLRERLDQVLDDGVLGDQQNASDATTTGSLTNTEADRATRR